jgi:hypothetical protein
MRFCFKINRKKLPILDGGQLGLLIFSVESTRQKGKKPESQPLHDHEIHFHFSIAVLPRAKPGF